MPFVAGSRDSVFYAFDIALTYAVAVIPKENHQNWRMVRYCGYVLLAAATGAVVATFALDTVLTVGGSKEPGLVLEALLPGWNAATSSTTFRGYHLGHGLAGLATLLHTFGIGHARAAGLAENISGLAHGILVPQVELRIALASCALAILV